MKRVDRPWGHFKLFVSDTLSINGSISANGADGSGGGSGGSIYVPPTITTK